MARARRRKARKNARRGRRVKRRVRRINVGRRRRRRNPTAVQAVYGPMGAPFASGGSTPTKAKRGKRRKARRLTPKQRRNRRLRHKLLLRSKRLHASARKAKRGSYRRSSLMTQAHRASTLRHALVRGRPMKRTAVYKAMHVKANPGLAGLANTAKVLLPHVGIGAGALVGAAWAGKKVSAMLVKDAAGATRKAFQDTSGGDKAVVKYMPAISTAGVAVAGYLLADKFAPKFKGAVVIGGLLGSVVQAIIAASADAKAGTVMARVREALLGPAAVVIPSSVTATPGAAAAAGLGGGIFRQVGDYTMVGDAYGTGRPRGSADNATQWAMNGYDRGSRPRLSADNATQWSMNGVDDSTNFAPGEGGVLSGAGIFR